MPSYFGDVLIGDEVQANLYPHEKFANFVFLSPMFWVARGKCIEPTPGPRLLEIAVTYCNGLCRCLLHISLGTRKIFITQSYFCVSPEYVHTRSERYWNIMTFPTRMFSCVSTYKIIVLIQLNCSIAKLHEPYPLSESFLDNFHM